jgi:hypothetical protein
MNTTTILLVLGSIVISGILSYYHYIYQSKNQSKVIWLLTGLRFGAILALLLLIINPIISKSTIETVKTPLPIFIDNSASIKDLKADESALATYNKLKENASLEDKFDVQLYQFDANTKLADTINFKGKQSNLDDVAKNLKTLYKNQRFPSILITDGNQTTGEDFVYSFNPDNKVYPIVVGDTTQYLDLRISQLNVNKYAFHKNKFPVEVFLNYTGNKTINANFKITQGNSILNQQTVPLSPSHNSATLNVLLPADKVGLQLLKASISSKEHEKNIYNNDKNFAVEVIDQKTEVALVSTIAHPDLGALKRSIESNAQRKVTIVKPNEIKSISDYNVLILYQPNVAFKEIMEANKVAKVNSWIITGNDTDFNFLNQFQNNFTFKMSNQSENFLALYDTQFNLFALEDFGFEQFPPLENPYGNITPKVNGTNLLSSSIHTIETHQPLLSFVDNQGIRSAYLFGENIWKWRANSFIAQKSFTDFDVFIDKTIQYLSTNNSKKNLVVVHEHFYNSGDNIEITAQYFNKNYELDDKAQLSIKVTNTKTNQSKTFDLLRAANAFQVNLDGLAPGKYVFKVTELNSKASYTNTFNVLDFDIEKQFVNPDWKKLNQLANQTKGKAYLTKQTRELIQNLLNDDSYKAIQKTVVKKSPLIDWKLILVVLVLLFGSEWFIRKYNGLL